MKVDVKLTAVFEEAEEGGYIAYLEEIPGVNTRGHIGRSEDKFRGSLQAFC